MPLHPNAMVRSCSTAPISHNAAYTLPCPCPQVRGQGDNITNKVICAVATQHGPKIVEAILQLSGHAGLKAGEPINHLWTGSIVHQPLLLAFNAKITQKDNHNAAFYARTAITCRLYPNYPHYDFYKTGLLHLATELRSAVGYGATQPAAAAATMPSTDQYVNPAYGAEPGVYTNATINTYNTTDPTVTINGNKQPCCTLEITTDQGNKVMAAIIDDDVFKQLPYHNNLNTPLATTPICDMVDFLSEDHPGIIATVTIANKYDTSIVTNLTNISEPHY